MADDKNKNQDEGLSIPPNAGGPRRIKTREKQRARLMAEQRRERLREQEVDAQVRAPRKRHPIRKALFYYGIPSISTAGAIGWGIGSFL